MWGSQPGIELTTKLRHGLKNVGPVFQGQTAVVPHKDYRSAVYLYHRQGLRESGQSLRNNPCTNQTPAARAPLA
ncbi:hypothetical protein BaRGS_00021043 [Batillaria attramentaria]|uniref:Uncharacterized protein n=1 Tax=Batillaria attramentaria TaxID=370345 RepID=A0ABD0KLA1_9CAEN